MKVYCIDAPYISNGLKKTYFKKLEVFGCELHDNGAIIAKALYSYDPKKDKWVLHKKIPNKGFPKCTKEQVMTEVPDVNKTYIPKGRHVYASLELAQAAKLLYIQQMGYEYEKEIVAIQSNYKRNVPDINKPLEALSKEHPELFI